jgi:ArsR family transcriptional regulator
MAVLWRAQIMFPPASSGSDTPASDCERHGEPPVQLRISSQQASSTAAIFKALSHPVRVQIVDILSRYGGQVCVCQIEPHFNLRQPTISHHLKVLRDAGLITSEQRGLWVYYDIIPGALEPATALLQRIEDVAPGDKAIQP